MQEYTLTRGGKILLLVLLIPMLACSILGCMVPFFEHDGASIFAGLVSPFCVIILVYALFRVNEKFIVDSYSIRHQARFLNRELPLQDIQGYRVNEQYLYLVPYPGRGKRIRISAWVGNFIALRKWAASRFPDLDKTPAAQSYEIPGLDNEKTITDKRRKQARIEIYALDGITVILALSSWFLDGPPWWAPVLSTLCLIASIFLLKRYKDIVQLEDLLKSRYPSMFIPAMVSCTALLLGTRNIHVLKYDHVWSPVIVITAVLTGLLYNSGSHLEWKKTQTAISAVLLLLFFFGGSIGIVLQLNRIMEKTAPEYFEAQVSNKRAIKDKNISYYLKLSPWGPQTSAEEIEVPFAAYEKVNVNEKVAVHLHAGGLGIPWYAVTLP